MKSIQNEHLTLPVVVENLVGLYQIFPVAEAISPIMCHCANISFRIGKSYDVNTANGHILDKDGMKLWDREYEKGWEPKL